MDALSVPAAGFGPAAFRSSGGRSYRLSYAGIVQSQRWDSNPHPPLYESGARPIELRRQVSTPARSRTWTSTFGGSRDVRFTTRVDKFRGLESSQRLRVQSPPS